MKSTRWYGYKVGDIIVSLRNLKPYREVGDMFKIISLTDVMYYKKQTNSSSPEEWRLATKEEITLFNSGVTHINYINPNITPQYEIY